MQRVRLHQQPLQFHAIEQLAQRCDLTAGISGIGALGNGHTQTVGIQAYLGNQGCLKVSSDHAHASQHQYHADVMHQLLLASMDRAQSPDCPTHLSRDGHGTASCLLLSGSGSLYPLGAPRSRLSGHISRQLPVHAASTAGLSRLPLKYQKIKKDSE